MNYKCFFEGKEIYNHEVYEEEEDKLDFMIAAENALEELNKKNIVESIIIDVVSDLGTKKKCKVIREMKPRFIAKLVEDV